MKNLRKKAFVLLLGSLLCAGLVSCRDNETPTEENGEINISVNFADDFIESVNQIETVTLESKDKIDLCIMLYSCIEETTIDQLNRDDVIQAKSKLDGYILEYNTLKNADIEDDKNESLIAAFVSAVAELPSTDLVSLEDLSKLLNAEGVYDVLSDTIKANADVVAAKATLDAVRAEYDMVASLDTDAYNAHKYVLLVTGLPLVNDITINDLTEIEKVVALYDSLTQAHKASEDVVNAKALFDTYEAKITELKISQANATEFIMAVFSLPTGSALKYQNAEQAAKINQAFTLYNALTDFEKEIIGVADAYSELNIIKNTFEALKEPYDISKIQPTNLCLYYYDGPKTLTFASGKDPISVLISDYGLTAETIKDNVKIYLDVYIEGGAIKGSPLYSFDITEDYSVTVADVYARLIELRDAGNEAIKSQGYTFTIHIESLNDQYGDSEYSNFFSNGSYPIV